MNNIMNDIVNDKKGYNIVTTNSLAHKPDGLLVNSVPKIKLSVILLVNFK